MTTGPLVLALAAAFGYSLATIFLKVALLRGATAARVNFLANLAMGLAVQPLWFFASDEVPDAPVWKPLLCAATFFLGQVFTFAALARGDVSVATPLLGMKVILVTVINAMLFGMNIPFRWWLAAIASSVALVLITMGPSGGKRRAVVWTAAYSLCAATAFSFTDAVVQHWGGADDPMAYLPTMFGSVALISTLFYAATNRVVFDPRGYASAPLILGGLLLALQATCVFVSLVWSRDATAVNVVYSSRSVWSVVLAWAGGAAFGLKEGGLRVMLTRLVGALLLFGAILLILW